MSSRREKRVVGAGQTTARSSRAPCYEVAPLSMKQQASLPVEPGAERAQTAMAPRFHRGGLGASSSRRASTAASDGKKRSPQQQDIRLIPPAAPPDMSTYGADESKEFYTSSPACHLGRIFSDSALISPSWTRATASPWGQSAKMCGGYGRRVVNGSNAVDAPDFMYSKIFDGPNWKQDFSWKKRPRPFAFRGEARTAVSDDSPNFFRGKYTQVYGKPIVEHINKPRLIKLVFGRQVMAEPAVPETEQPADEPLVWDDASSSLPTKPRTSDANRHRRYR